MPKPKIQVKQPVAPQDEVPFEVLATSIREISKFGKLIAKSPLKKRTILLLIKDETHVSMNDIEKVLNALPELEKLYCK